MKQFVPLALVAAVLTARPAPAAAQAALRTVVVASGLSRPVGFVQDPSDPTVQYIVQHTGQILVLKNGAVRPRAFLDLSAAIINRGERGLLGLAFPPDYGTSGRFYVSFSAADFGEGAGHTVLARFQRSQDDPLVADPWSRFDVRWSTGERFIRQPFDLHRAGHLAFGPDGYLYVATGDGGVDIDEAGDPLNKAQDLSSLLGKILRLDVRVADANADGFVVPSDNPFVATPGAAPEIWSLGLRNPWQFSFDAGTGAMVIGDVGHDHYEEVDYEPAGRGGRNYGWRIREGAHDFDLSQPPSVLPLQDPVFEYDHGTGRSLTGGFVYRGQALGAAFAGRYVFADFMARRLFSLALTVDPVTGEATASDLRDHTQEVGGTAAIGGVSAFGVDAAGEIYIVSLNRGEILRLTTAGTAVLTLDGVTPQPGLLDISGWAIDSRAAAGSGVDAIHAYAYPFAGGGAPVFLGAATSFHPRPDIGAVFGAQFGQSGFRIQSTRWLHPGPTLIAVYGRSTVSGAFDLIATTYFEALDLGQFVHSLDQRPAGAVAQPILFSGWALDYHAGSAPASQGTGIAAVYVDLFSSGVLVRTIPAAYGLPRPDVASIFGPRHLASGFSATIHDLWPGEFSYRVRYVRTTGGEWYDEGPSTFTVTAGPIVAIGVPVWGGTVPSTFLIGGWAIDLRSAAGTGVDAIHVWAYPNPGSGTPPVFLGAADYGAYRPDVGGAFGPQFTYSGFNLIAGPLAPGTYDVVVFARTTASGAFEIYGVVRVTVR